MPSTKHEGLKNLSTNIRRRYQKSAIRLVAYEPLYLSHLRDTRALPARRAGTIYSVRQSDSAMLIDATLKQKMPPLALPAREFMDGARKIWDELGLPPLTVRQPWHGYTLGDWELSGEDTLKRQRGGAGNAGVACREERTELIGLPPAAAARISTRPRDE